MNLEEFIKKYPMFAGMWGADQSIYTMSNMTKKEALENFEKYVIQENNKLTRMLFEMFSYFDNMVLVKEKYPEYFI